MFGMDRNNPAVYISWNDVKVFIQKLNRKEGENKYRLPTEAEWEYACRASSQTAYSFGDSPSNLGSYAWYCTNAKDKGDTYAHAVAQKKANAWGLYDMHGNVWEWCEDWYGDYPSGSVTDPARTSSGSFRVGRGGSWNSSDSYCRAAFRINFNPSHGYSRLGFRLSRAL